MSHIMHVTWQIVWDFSSPQVDFPGTRLRKSTSYSQISLSWAEKGNRTKTSLTTLAEAIQKHVTSCDMTSLYNPMRVYARSYYAVSLDCTTIKLSIVKVGWLNVVWLARLSLWRGREGPLCKRRGSNRDGLANQTSLNSIPRGNYLLKA